MGRDTDAITVVGVKIPIEQFGVNCRDCNLCDGEFLSCEGCLKNLREDIRKKIDTSSGRCFLGPYEIYQEVYDNEFQNLYICIYKGEKSGSETEVVYPHTLEQLLSERDKLLEYLSRLHLTNFTFGIFTLLYMTY